MEYWISHFNNIIRTLTSHITGNPKIGILYITALGSQLQKYNFLTAV